MLAFVPVTFALYRPLKPRLRWAMQCLVSFADHAGRCFPSIRTFALHAGSSRSAAQRDLADLVATGYVTRKRRPGGVYIYQIDQRFLPSWPKKLVSQRRHRKQQGGWLLQRIGLRRVSQIVGLKKIQVFIRKTKGTRASARDSLSLG
jgi:hypothetical protein